MPTVRTAFVVERRSPNELAQVCREMDMRGTLVDEPAARALVVFPALSSSPSLQTVVDLASRFSEGLGAPVLAMSRGTPCLLWLGLFKEGKLVVDYDSATRHLPWKAYAKTLATTFSRPDRWRSVRLALTTRWTCPDRLRHWLIVKSLDLPTWIPKYSNVQLSAAKTALHERAFDIRAV